MLATELVGFVMGMLIANCANCIGKNPKSNNDRIVENMTLNCINNHPRAMKCLLTSSYLLFLIKPMMRAKDCLLSVCVVENTGSLVDGYGL